MNNEAPRSRPASWKWWITGLLLLATMINYMDRVTLANASVRVTRELGLSEAQYGNLELAFGWAFAAGSLVFGFLADRLRVYLLYPAVLAAWSLMGMAAGWSNGFSELMVCRTLLGFFEAGHWPCALKTTFTLLNEKDRTMGNSVLQSGASIGAIVTPQIMKVLMTDQPGSWRTTFVVVGAVGFLWVAAWLILMRPRDLDRAPAPAEKKNDGLALGVILRSGRFWAVALLILGAQTVWHIYRVWLMKFLQTGRGYGGGPGAQFQLRSTSSPRMSAASSPASFRSGWSAGAQHRRTMRGARCMQAHACSRRSASSCRGWTKAGRCSPRCCSSAPARSRCSRATTASCRNSRPRTWAV